MAKVPIQDGCNHMEVVAVVVMAMVVQPVTQEVDQVDQVVPMVAEAEAQVLLLAVQTEEMADCLDSKYFIKELLC